jgi:hypothetical protein
VQTFPNTLTPEEATWLRLQCTVAATRIAQPLSIELDDLDGFLNGLLVVVAQLVPALLQTNPTVGDVLCAQWKHAADRYEAMSAGEAPGAQDEPLAHLEARHLLYRACEERGLWSANSATSNACSARAPRSTRQRRMRH